MADSRIGDGGDWWKDAVGYEVYVRSFADGDGDGVGDLRGLHDRLDHLARLGVEVVWLTPFYPSPMRDHGYDVADYRGVDPVFGSLADLDAVVERTHELGMRLVIDLVPNHCSSDHPWFAEAIADPASPMRDRFVFRPGRGDGPPNNWVSHFGGPAWTRTPDGQWYLHLFLPEQPDFDWTHPAVRAEFESILRFWLERGVDGFRIDVAQALLVDPELRDNPLNPDPGTRAQNPEFNALLHVHDLAQPGSLEIFESWRRIADGFGAALIGEVYLDPPERIAPFVAPGRLHAAFTFDLMHIDWAAEEIHEAITRSADHLGATAAWVQASHDEPRPATRFGSGELGRRRSLGLAALLAALPGMWFIYQGEELGMGDGDIPPDRLQDPIALRLGPGARHRDGCRTPMPWEPVGGYGFSTGEPWLPYGDHGPDDTAAAQWSDPASPLRHWQRLVELRRGCRDRLPDEAEVRVDAGAVIVERGPLAAVLAIEPAEVPLDAGTEVLWRSDQPVDRRDDPGVDAIVERSVALAVDGAVLLWRSNMTVEHGG